MFHVGQKVVRVSSGSKTPREANAALRHPHLTSDLPTVGGVYTVRKIVRCSYDGETSLLLKECDNSHYPGLEPAFGASHFRPVRETNIDVFTAMLVPSRETERVS